MVSRPRTHKEADGGAPAERINPFQAAQAAFNVSLLSGKYEVTALITALDTMGDQLNVGLKPGDKLGTVKRLGTVITMASQAATLAQYHGDEKFVEYFRGKAQRFEEAAQVLEPKTIKEVPTTPPAKKMEAPKK